MYQVGKFKHKDLIQGISSSKKRKKELVNSSGNVLMYNEEIPWNEFCEIEVAKALYHCQRKHG